MEEIKKSNQERKKVVNKTNNLKKTNNIKKKSETVATTKRKKTQNKIGESVSKEKNTKGKETKKTTIENKNRSKKKNDLKPVVVNKNSKAVVKTKDKSLIIKDIKEEFSFKKENLKIIPLGGIEEIGKNITVFEYGNDIVLIDCGVAFPEDDMLGIDLVIPDFTYLIKNKEKIRGLVITHGHEDHIEIGRASCRERVWQLV